MTYKLQFKSITSRLVFLFFAVAIIPLIIVSIIVYQQRAQSIRMRELNKLVAIRDLKVEQVNAWLDERTGDIRTVASDGEIRKLCDLFNRQNTIQPDLNIISETRKLLERYIQNYNSFYEIFIIDSASGKTTVSSNTLQEGKDRSDDEYFTGPMHTKKIYIKDIYYSDTVNRPSMTFSVPVFSYSDDRHIAGIAVAKINLERSLYNLLLQRTGLGKTGETLIVNKDVVALNELRWHENAPLKLKIGAEPAVLASRRQTGIVETTDYREEKILAAFTYIPRTKWGFIAKQDIAEIYAPVNTMFRQLAMIIAIVAAAIFIIAVLTARTIARPLLEMTKMARKIQAGDLSARNNIDRSDEFGFLGLVFNEMTNSVTSRMRVQQGSSDITGVMVAYKTLDDFSREILKKIIKVTNSDFGVFCICNEEENKFEHLCSVGANKELMEPFDADILEGQAGAALLSQKITRIKNIPEDTIFKFRTFAGTAIPKEIITIPVLVSEKTAALISVACLSKYSDESLEILNLTRPGLNTALSNLLASEKTAYMAEDLQARNEEMAAINEELQSQSEELQQQASELQEQTYELQIQQTQVEEADRLKSEFLSNMSHELRTPLNSVLVLSRLMISRGTGKKPEEDAEYLEVIERNGQRLLNLINDILDLSKIESGRMDIISSDFDSRQLVENVLETVLPLAKSKGLDILTDIADVPNIFSDMDKVQQIVLNLVSNAVKFTQKGEIEINVTCSGHRAVFAVRDTGIGIPGSALQNIFEEFRQVDGSTTREYEGTGLGLAISQKFARLLGGEITVQSQPGKGSTFALVLPLKYDPGEKQEQKAIPGPVQKPPVSPVKPLKLTVLVIDDEPEVCNLLKGHLNKAGYDVVTANSGREGIRLAKEVHPFAITLDILMPEMDGWEVLRHLKSSPDTVHIPVVIVSVSSDRTTGAALGATGYILKPVEKDVLLDEIKRISTAQKAQHILVIDDDPDVRLSMENILREQVYSVEQAPGGEQGLTLALKNLPDLIILDLLMPGMDGFTVLEQLKNNPRTRKIPVIILTAKDITVSERAELEGSAWRIIEKGKIGRQELLHEIDHVLADLEYRLPAGHGNKPEILVIEDNDVAAMQIKSALEENGFKVSAASNGAEGLERVKTRVPDAVILDLMMPGIDGFEVLETIRSTRWTTDLPVLILTAKELTRQERVQLKRNNVQQLVQKGSMDKEQIIAAVKRLITKQRAEQHSDPPALKPSEPGTVKRGRTILIVEDNPDNLFTITTILKGTEYEFITAEDGEKAVHMAKEFHPGLILMDIQLPVLSGLDATKQIKSDAALAEIPIIALTAKAMKGDRENILSAGCDDYLAKPLEPDILLDKIRKWMER